VSTAANRWAAGLRALAIPDELLSSAPADPYSFPPGSFRVDPLAEPVDTPSRRAALGALPDRGSVLDVGCGGGAASLALRPKVGSIVGVDTRAAALDDLAEAACSVGVKVRAVHGVWPEVAPDAGTVDVVVCHHVAYNVHDIVPFLRALSQAAKRRVVLEVTAAHPWEWFRPLWPVLTGWDRPAAPTANDLEAVLVESGVRPDVVRWERPSRFPPCAAELASELTGRLCLPADRTDDVAEAIERLGISPATDTITLSWSPQAPP
jgi:SAM-dependent methyltransferase